MKLLPTALLAGAALLSASALEVSSDPGPQLADFVFEEPELWNGFLAKLEEKAQWKPPKFTKRPDSEWDHIVDGRDVEAMMKATGQRVDGKFANKKLRIKEPVGLGVDRVKQYSGYIDVDEDKHIFFCSSRVPASRAQLMPLLRVL